MQCSQTLANFKPLPYFIVKSFSKECMSNISEVLLQKIMEIFISSNLKPTLDCLQPILIIYKSGRLMWSLVSKNNPSKTLYLKYCQTKRDLMELPRLVKKAIGK